MTATGIGLLALALVIVPSLSIVKSFAVEAIRANALADIIRIEAGMGDCSSPCTARHCADHHARGTDAQRMSGLAAEQRWNEPTKELALVDVPRRAVVLAVRPAWPIPVSPRLHERLALPAGVEGVAIGMRELCEVAT